MKTRVNLYLDEFRPTTYLINIGFTALLWGLAIGAIVFASVYVNQQKAQAEQRLQRVEQSMADKQKVIEMLSRARDKKGENLQLLAEIERVEQELSIKNEIITELTNRERRQASGYAQLMLDLARLHDRGLWLTSIHLDDNYVRIEGGATDSATVPKWVSKLNEANYFEGAQFAAASMYRDNQQMLRFVLSSRLEYAMDTGETIEQ